MCSLHKIATQFSCRLNRYTLTKLIIKPDYTTIRTSTISLDEFIKLHGIFALHIINWFIIWDITYVHNSFTRSENWPYYFRKCNIVSGAKICLRFLSLLCLYVSFIRNSRWWGLIWLLHLISSKYDVHVACNLDGRIS